MSALSKDAFQHLIRNRSIPDMTITSPTILPTFRPFAHDTYLDNPTCRLVLSGSATVPPSSIASLAEWAMEFDTPVLVSNAFFGRAEEAGQAAPEVTLESLCGVSASRYATPSSAYSGSDRPVEIIPLPRRLRNPSVLSLPAKPSCGNVCGLCWRAVQGRYRRDCESEFRALL